MVKFRLFILSLILGTSCLFAQNKSKIFIDAANVNTFVHEIHQENSKKFLVNNEDEIEQMKRFLKNNVFFIQFKNLPDAVTGKLSNFSAINKRYVQEKFDPKSFNPFLYNLDQISEPEKIHIDGTRYVLFVYPISQD